MSYRWVEHTAELGLEVEAASEEELFAESAHALAELLDGAPGKQEQREVRLEQPERAALLVAWLEELLFLAETESFVAEEADIELQANALHAIVTGRRAQARPFVKGVTYHGLALERLGEGWRAKVVLDV